jgi:hypothetical protein
VWLLIHVSILEKTKSSNPKKKPSRIEKPNPEKNQMIQSEEESKLN